MCLLLCFLPVFAHHWLVIFHLLSYTVITVTTCTSMTENEKYAPSLQYLTLLVLKEVEDYSNHNMWGGFFPNQDQSTAEKLGNVSVVFVREITE